MENEIIKAATSAIKLRSTSGSVPDFSKNAQAIVKNWIKKMLSGTHTQPQFSGEPLYYNIH